jgi:hypothetical protein
MKSGVRRGANRIEVETLHQFEACLATCLDSALVRRGHAGGQVRFLNGWGHAGGQVRFLKRMVRANYRARVVTQFSR